MTLSRSASPRDGYERFLVTHLEAPKDDNGGGDGDDNGMLLHPWNTNVLQVKYALTQLYREGEYILTELGGTGLQFMMDANEELY